MKDRLPIVSPDGWTSRRSSGGGNRTPFVPSSADCGRQHGDGPHEAVAQAMPYDRSADAQPRGFTLRHRPGGVHGIVSRCTTGSGPSRGPVGGSVLASPGASRKPARMAGGCLADGVRRRRRSDGDRGGRRARGSRSRADVKDLEVLPSVINRTVAEFGGVDILVNNARRGDLAAISRHPRGSHQGSDPLQRVGAVRAVAAVGGAASPRASRRFDIEHQLADNARVDPGLARAPHRQDRGVAADIVDGRGSSGRGIRVNASFPARSRPRRCGAISTRKTVRCGPLSPNTHV